MAFGFGGYLTNTGTDELYAFARTYAPGMGRFNESDPVRSFDPMMAMGLHRYVLGYGNSLKYVDPDGRIGYLSDLVDNFDQIDQDLRSKAAGSEGFGNLGYNAARGFMSAGSWLARGTNLASDVAAQSWPMSQFDATAGVADQASQNLSGAVDAIANPVQTTRALHERAVSSTTAMMEGNRGAYSDLFSVGFNLAAGAGAAKLMPKMGSAFRVAENPSGPAPRLELMEPEALNYGDLIQNRVRDNLGADIVEAEQKVLAKYADSTALRTHRNLDLTINERGMMSQERSQAKAAGWKRLDGSTWWPPYDGALPGTQRIVSLAPSSVNSLSLVDRFGVPAGRYVSPAGISLESRALSSVPAYAPSVYSVDSVISGVERAKVAPWFGQSGLGVQYHLPNTVQYYLDTQILREIQ